MKIFRTGSCWGVTIIAYDPAERPDDRGHRPSDELWATAQTPGQAAQMVAALNFHARRTAE